MIVSHVIPHTVQCTLINLISQLTILYCMHKQWQMFKYRHTTMQGFQNGDNVPLYPAYDVKVTLRWPNMSKAACSFCLNLWHCMYEYCAPNARVLTSQGSWIEIENIIQAFWQCCWRLLWLWMSVCFPLAIQLPEMHLFSDIQYRLDLTSLNFCLQACIQRVCSTSRGKRTSKHGISIVLKLACIEYQKRDAFLAAA